MTPSFPSEAQIGLEALNQRVRHDLELLDHGGPTWSRPDETVLDVVIVGGGQSGLGAAFGLLREKVRNILVLDENPPGQEGPWVTYARMFTLRTPKHLTAIDDGIPSLTFRAWWEAQHGTGGWASLDKIRRQDWMGYLRWFREITGVPVRNHAKVTAIVPSGLGLHEIALADGTRLQARKVVLATGIQGGGEWHTPAIVKDALSPERYAHTSDAIDFERLRGKRVAILGGGASAFDNAQHALAAGVGAAHVFVRRPALPQVNPIRHLEVTGLLRHFASFDDATKYAVIDSFLTRNQPPTNDTFERAKAQPGFALHLDSPWTAVRQAPEGQAVVTTPRGQFAYDFLILSTGLKTDASLRPELSAVAADIALWRDRYAPPAGQANALIDEHPYLGPGFELTAKTPAGQARLHGLFVFNYSALASLGLSASALSGLKYALPRLTQAVSRQLFSENQPALLKSFFDYDAIEFTGAWTPQLDPLPA